MINRVAINDIMLCSKINGHLIANIICAPITKKWVLRVEEMRLINKYTHS